MFNFIIITMVNFSISRRLLEIVEASYPPIMPYVQWLLIATKILSFLMMFCLLINWFNRRRKSLAN